MMFFIFFASSAIRSCLRLLEKHAQNFIKLDHMDCKIVMFEVKGKGFLIYCGIGVQDSPICISIFHKLNFLSGQCKVFFLFLLLRKSPKNQQNLKILPEKACHFFICYPILLPNFDCLWNDSFAV